MREREGAPFRIVGGEHDLRVAKRWRCRLRLHDWEVRENRKPTGTTRYVGAVTLPETSGVLHGAQIPEISRVQADCLGWSMSTPDQLLYTALHGTAMRYAAERRNLDESTEELRDIADGRNDILAEAAGITAGAWYAWPSTRIGHELIAAGMLILAGGGRGLPLDYDELERWTRVGFRAGYEIAQRGALNLTYPHACEKACRARYAGAMEQRARLRGVPLAASFA